jgi:hypothetical protein
MEYSSILKIHIYIRIHTLYIGSQSLSASSVLIKGIHDRVHVNQVPATAVVHEPLEYANLGHMSSCPNFWHRAKRRFLITSNLRYMHEILNVDEIKN